MSRISAVKIDSEGTKDGVWVDYAADIRLKLRRLHNPDILSAMRKKSKKTAIQEQYQIQVGTGEDTDDMKKLVAEFVLVGWENLDDDDDNEIVYSVDNAMSLFINPDFADFYGFVITASSQRELFRKGVDEERLGKSSPGENEISQD